MNQVTIMGRLTRDPEISYNNATGNAMTRFSVAVDRKLSREKRQEMESRNQPTADFISCVCWGKLAETVNNFTAKGKRVIVEGRLQTGSYMAQDGTRRYTTDVVANAVEFIDWKDRDGGFGEPQQRSSQNNFQQNNAQQNYAPQNNNAQNNNAQNNAPQNNFPQNDQVAPANNGGNSFNNGAGANVAENANNGGYGNNMDDDFFGEDFNAVDDDRIPF